MPYTKIKPEQIKVYPLALRKSKSDIKKIAVNPDNPPPPAPEIAETVKNAAERIRFARKSGATVILAFGAHLVKNGAAPLLIKLMEQNWITHLATQGAGGIHDWEFAFHGKSEEDVRANAATGTFGTWEETGKFINLAIQAGALKGMGYGESLGACIENEGIEIPSPEQLEHQIKNGLAHTDDLLPARTEFLQTIKKFKLTSGFMRIQHPYKQYSIFGNAYRLKVPVTVHPGIGYDIIYNNPYANGAALGRGAHIDYGIFVNSALHLSNGVFLSIGSAIMAPQVFEKALSFANNILLRNGEKISNFFILIDDLQESVWNWTKGEPPKNSPDYYLRFLKSFHRMGGNVKYIAADNRLLLHHLYAKLNE